MPRKKQYSEKEVVEKATKVFWKKGYTATSIRTLEKEMGINQFSIYASFGSKKGVFLRALSHYRSEIKEVFLSDLVKSDGRLCDIETFFHTFIKSVKSGKTPNGCLMANTAMEIGNNDAEVKVQLKLFFAVLHGVFLDLLKKAKTKEALSQDANIEMYANFLVGCTEGLAVTAKVLGRKQLNDFVDVTLRALK